MRLYVFQVCMPCLTMPIFREFLKAITMCFHLIARLFIGVILCLVKDTILYKLIAIIIRLITNNIIYTTFKIVICIIMQ